MFGYSTTVEDHRSGTIFVALVGIFLGGCGSDQPRTPKDDQYYGDQASAVFAPIAGASTDSDPSIGQRSAHPTIGGWSIVLSNVGNEGMDRAKEMLRIVQGEQGLKEAYIDRRSSGLVIAYGDYLSKEDPRVVRDLQRIRKMEINGAKLFSGAIITPPTSRSLHGTNPSYDLRTVKERFGDRAVYTLQVGIYGRGDYQPPSAEDLLAFRRAAEEAVRTLRAQGEMAFYYHAPARSMVTIGVLSEQDFDPSTRPPMQSQTLLDLRERFPNNLLNGQGIRETIRTESGKVTQLQSSQLVAIPEN